MKLLDDGVTTEEHVSVPECVHTVTMEWFSSYRDSDDVSTRVVMACSNMYIDTPHDQMSYSIIILNNDDRSYPNYSCSEQPPCRILFIADQTINIQYKQVHVTKVTCIHDVYQHRQAHNISCVNRMMRLLCVHWPAPCIVWSVMTCHIMRDYDLSISSLLEYDLHIIIIRVWPVIL